MNNDENCSHPPADDAAHKAQVDAIAEAVAGLLPKFAPRGFTADAVFEGSIKGAAVAMMLGTGARLVDIADLLDGYAAGFRNIVDPKRASLHVVE